MTNETKQYFDVVIIGAGLSGIGAAYHIQKKCPRKTYTILEGRSDIGGTWDLFRYPGIRSDSDMYTLGFSFNPWEDAKAIADGPAILQYIKDTAQKFGIAPHIRFNHRVIAANWSDAEKMWTLHIEPQNRVICCRFLVSCTGYYNYEHGYEPTFAGSESFAGTIIHPQKWDDKLQYADKKVVIIGSGATAVTLVPEMAKKAAHVVMLQRSPTYIVNLPSKDKIANLFRQRLPSKVAYQLARWKNILLSMLFYQIARRAPNVFKRMVRKGIQKELGTDYDLRHFDPQYQPWDQRLCLVPDSDLFKALRQNKAEIVTDTIERFTPKGILLKSGRELEADIIVTATGLQLQMLGGIDMRVNNETRPARDIYCYRGTMFSDIPNFAIAIGYTNASWTLKCDLNCHYITRILNYMDKKGYQVCTPRFDSQRFKPEPLLNFNAGYVLRSIDEMPRQGSAAPWKMHQNYLRDSLSLRYGTVDDAYLQYQ